MKGIGKQWINTPIITNHKVNSWIYIDFVFFCIKGFLSYTMK
jgi:hypothetical protein